MAQWAIAYDLDVKRMKRDGMTRGQVVMFYQKVRTCLKQNQFELFKQFSLYTSAADNTLTNAFKACQELRALTDSNKYIKRLHLFRVEDFNDLLPLVADRSSAGKEVVEEEIEEAFGASQESGTQAANSS
ncbi:hypothetical protein WME89_27365 [Sorangium sp. So ce321]|uniref:hypothetical protein n=1 Tax=Sorangium sp. So ce321 TaxID=3133300 RepID=UPI003F5ED6F2